MAGIVPSHFQPVDKSGKTIDQTLHGKAQRQRQDNNIPIADNDNLKFLNQLSLNILYTIFEFAK